MSEVKSTTTSCEGQTVRLHHNAVDLTGRRFGKLVVEAFHSRAGTGRVLMWQCRCNCGKAHIARAAHLTTGRIISCGCIRDANIRAGIHRTHGKTGTSEHTIWLGMHQRCNDPGSTNYANYGGRGIQVCERWYDFANFYADMGPRPSKDHSIDRIDNDGNYAIGNCRWATKYQQGRNKRNTRLLTAFGETKCMEDWAIEREIPASIIHRRLQFGWSTEEALSQLRFVNQSRQVKHDTKPLLPSGPHCTKIDETS